MCCTFYLKSSLYNLITALKRGTQYSCFPQQVVVLCPPLTRSRLRCLGRGQNAREHRGQAGRREARGQQRRRDPEGAGQQRHWGDPDPLHLRLLEPLSLGAPVLKPDLDLELEKLVSERGGEISQARGVLALWVSIIFYLGALCTNCNMIPTWVSESLRSALNSARSEMLRYCFSLYFFSRLLSCAVVKGVRGFLLGLCFLRRQRIGPGGGRRVMSEKFREFSEIALPEKNVAPIKSSFV